MIPNLGITALLEAYRAGVTTPQQVVLEAWQRAEEADPAIWISRPTESQLRSALAALENESPDTKPLYGIPFAIKDNIDCQGYPTTAACPSWNYEPAKSAFVVQQLINAGAIPIGKTNLDQFATGLVGVRSPYGVPSNAFHPDYISGGSSSGSSVAVALGLCSFALGTDTAGSGRVPASFNNLIGLKPTRGLLSCSGVVPACRTLDCVSIFTLTAADAAQVLKVAAVYDADDSYAREIAPRTHREAVPRIGIPMAGQLDFLGDRDAECLYASALETSSQLGWQLIEIDLNPFLEAARLLYEGPWVAERTTAIQELLISNPEALLPVTRQIIAGGLSGTAVGAFSAQYRLAELKRITEPSWNDIDALLLPTAATCYTKAALAAEPIALNSNLGRYTNFMNLLDLCGCAVPAGFTANGVPWGITFCAPAADDALVLNYAGRFHQAVKLPLGKTTQLSNEVSLAPAPPITPTIKLAVCGAHLEGLALHWQLKDRQALLISRTQSAPCYKLYLLAGHDTIPDRPGMIRVSTAGASIALEIWEIPQSTLGSFLAGIASPLGLGRVELADGTQVCGFICEGQAAETSQDITSYGGWRAWLARA
jgi:allophanate hydrolase